MTRLSLVAVAAWAAVACAAAPPIRDPSGLTALDPAQVMQGAPLCYHLCDTEVRDLTITAKSFSCSCKVRDEIPSKIVPTGQANPDPLPPT